MFRNGIIIIVLFVFFSAAKADPVEVRSTDNPYGDFAIYVNNRAPAAITITFKLELQNLRVDGGLLPSYTVPAGRNLRVISGRRIRNAAWNYSYKYHYKWGSPRARHDPDAVYILPIKPGTSAKILQGYDGKFSHKGSERFSIDWDLPEGTEVYAARDGTVVQVIGKFSKPGRSIEFKDKGNVAIIVHPDGTVGNYVHFRKDGVVVVPGQKVKAGDLIGYSGNTGYSTQPHLHFDVNCPIDGHNRQTIPIVFRTKEGLIAELKQGEFYTSVR